MSSSLVRQNSFAQQPHRIQFFDEDEEGGEVVTGNDPTLVQQHPHPQPDQWIQEEEEEEEEFEQTGTSLLSTSQIAIILVCISVVLNLLCPVFLLSGTFFPLLKFTDANGTVELLYLTTRVDIKADGEETESDEVHRCLTHKYVSAFVGSTFATVALVVALALVVFARRWATGIKRFVRPFMLCGASVGGIVASVLVLWGHIFACNGENLWFQAQVGAFTLIFGSALTVLLTMLLFAQVSRYPLEGYTEPEAVVVEAEEAIVVVNPTQLR